MGEKFRKSEGKKPLEERKRRGENNITIEI
jgi:hypothetical protein